MKIQDRRTMNTLLGTRYISVSGARRQVGSSRRSGDPDTGIEKISGILIPDSGYFVPEGLLEAVWDAIASFVFW